MVKDWIATPLGFGKQDGRLRACLSCLIAAAVWVVGLVVNGDMQPGSACLRLQEYYCTVPLQWQTGRLAHWHTDLSVRLWHPWLLGSLSNERPAALDPDRATGPWVSLISPEFASGGGRVFPRRETSDSQTATTMRPMPKPQAHAHAHHQNEASPQPSPTADCWPFPATSPQPRTPTTGKLYPPLSCIHSFTGPSRTLL